jgi:hypothetical protein
LAGTSDDLLYVEVSADQDADPDDRAQWAKGNPSYPSRTKEAAILRMRRILGEESFLREGLGIWLDESKSKGVIPMAEWAAANQSKLGITLRPPETPAIVGLAMTHDREWASLVWTWQVDGRTAVDVVRAEGTDWILPYLVQRRQRIAAVAVDQGGPAGTLLPALGATGLTVRVADTAAYKAACAGLVDVVKYGRFIHRGDPALDAAAALVRWRSVGEGQVFARKDSGVPIDALEGAALGNWALQPDPKKKEFSIMNLADFTK